MTLKNKEKSFFHKHTSEIEQDLSKLKKKFTYKALVALKKKILFRDFFHIWKIAGQLLRIFQEFKTLYKPCVNLLKANERYFNNILVVTCCMWLMHYHL